MVDLFSEYEGFLLVEWFLKVYQENPLWMDSERKFLYEDIGQKSVIYY